MSEGPSGTDYGWWLRVLPGWHLSFGVVTSAVAVMLWRDTAPWYAFIVLALIVAGYSFLVVPALQGRRPVPAQLYLAAAFGGVLALTTVNSGAYLMLYILYPLTFVLVEPTALAAGLCAGLAAISTVISLVRNGWTTASAWSLVASQDLLTLAFALLIGFLATHLLAENRRRGALIQELEGTRAALSAVQHQAGVQAERERMAQEIHDTIAQGLASLLMLVQDADRAIADRPERAHERLAMATRVVKDNLAETRSLVAALAPADLREAPLQAAIERIVSRTKRELELDATFRVAGTSRRLESNVQVVVVRAVQEAIANVRKHAQATRVDVLLAYLPESVRVEVSDNGCGFDPRQADGFGLQGMRARVEQIHGSLTIDSAPGTGARITLEVG
jgi:signal transduction histidine kinase